MLLPLATSLTNVSALATGAGTLVLAIATFAAVRSSNRSARIAEVALREQRRPIFTQSRLDDPPQKIMFVEGRWVQARGSHGAAEHDGSVYLAMSLRNVGAGIGVCQGWHVTPVLPTSTAAADHTPEEEFRLQSRDLYIPAGDLGMWQGALRDRNDRTYQAVAEAIDNQQPITIELLYSDQVGDQRTISRFALYPFERTDEDGNVRVQWFASINRHWYLDRPGPRSDEQVAAAVDVILRERDAAEETARAEEEEAETPDEASDVDRVEPAPAEPNGGSPAETESPEPVPVVVRPNCE